MIAIYSDKDIKIIKNSYEKLNNYTQSLLDNALASGDIDLFLDDDTYIKMKDDHLKLTKTLIPIEYRDFK